MNWFNMPVHSAFVGKALPQLLQLNSCFLSWNDSICPFNDHFEKKLYHNHHIWMTALLQCTISPHEQKICVASMTIVLIIRRDAWNETFDHKFYIWMTFFISDIMSLKRFFMQYLTFEKLFWSLIIEASSQLVN